ncbi:MAG: DNA polymerase III subunit gamma/tau [Clostridiales bacterium]|nr:DNA polymerase III subunit gamma/tau [Clostridiales bacterium]
MYQALYRKYRPKTFDDVVGQEHITETLKKQVETGRLSHAYLFIGTRGTGKTTCAKILAKAVNCEHPVNGNPCNQCAACRGIDDGSILDVVELDAASNNGVDNVRALRDEAVFSPASVRKRVYIVDEVHMLSNSAFNALLKILEEPPEHLMFILATTELHKVPATILSRCQRHSFKRIPVDTITARLNFVAQQEHLNLQPDAAALLARMADGGMRDALTLLDQCCGNECISTDAVISAIGLAGNLRTAQLLRSVAAGDTAGALEQFRALWQDGKDPSALLDELSMLQRDLLMQAVAPRGGRELLSGAYDPVTLDELSGAFSSAQLLANLQSIQQTLGAMASQPNPRIAAELCLIRLCRPELCDDVPTLCARMDRLEQTVYSGAIPAPAPKAKSEPKPVFDDVPPWEPPAPPVSAPKAKSEPKPVHDDVPPWEQPAPPVSAPKAKSEPKPIFDDVPPWEQPAPPVSAPKGKPEPKPVFDDVPPWEPPKTVPAPIPEPTPEPVPEPEPEPIPEPVSAPAPEAAPAEAGTFDWQALCAYMERELPVGIYHFLLDPLQAAGELADGTLTLHLNKAPAYPMFNKPEIAEKFRLAVQTLTGQNVRVVMQPMDTATQIKQRQIEELTRFPNVTIR